MNTPTDLLDDLTPNRNAVGYSSTSFMHVVHQDQRLKFSPVDCAKLLQSPKTVVAFKDALGPDAEKASIELSGLELTDAVLDKLESLFAAVDEV